MTFTISRRVASRLEQLKMLSAQIRLAVAAAAAAVDVAVDVAVAAAQSICVH